MRTQNLRGSTTQLSFPSRGQWKLTLEQVSSTIQRVLPIGEVLAQQRIQQINPSRDWSHISVQGTSGGRGKAAGCMWVFSQRVQFEERFKSFQELIVKRDLIRRLMIRLLLIDQSRDCRLFGVQLGESKKSGGRGEWYCHKCWCYFHCLNLAFQAMFVCSSGRRQYSLVHFLNGIVDSF